MAGSDKRKQSLYFPEDMLKEIQDEATRQDRSLSETGPAILPVNRPVAIIKSPKTEKLKS